MTGATELRVELLLGTKVQDSEGRMLGRLEEIHADRVDERCYVREFVVGPEGWMERMSGPVLPKGLLRLFGYDPDDARYIIPWEFLDLSDPERLRTSCRRDELP